MNELNQMNLSERGNAQTGAGILTFTPSTAVNIGTRDAALKGPWSLVTPPPTVSDSQYVVTNSATELLEFYRLSETLNLRDDYGVSANVSAMAIAVSIALALLTVS